jgi:pimeloyl-ACP methyl ester carboxylesterase
VRHHQRAGVGEVRADRSVHVRELPLAGQAEADYRGAETADQVGQEGAARMARRIAACVHGHPDLGEPRAAQQFGQPAADARVRPRPAEARLEQRAEPVPGGKRLAVTPGAFLRMTAMIRDIDVRDALPAIHVPTLVIHRTGDRITPPFHGRFLASRIAGARYFEQPGDHSLRFAGGGDIDALFGEIAGFLAAL